MMTKLRIQSRIGKSAAVCAGIALLVLTFQNCGKPFQSKTSSELSSTSLEPVLIDNCLDTDVDACVFNKNFVAQTKQSAIGRTPAQLEGEQKLAIQIGHLTENDQLKNNSFQVFQSGLTQSLGAKPDGSWRYRFTESDGSAKVGQVMSFYWANFAMENAIATTGKFYAAESKIKIITDDTLFGWAPSNNQIHLLKKSSGNSMAMDASTLVYFLGWANLDYATKGEISVISNSNHLVCGSDGRMDCCKSEMGCSRALASGQADYFVAMTFPDAPALGESWADSAQGQFVCQSAYVRHPDSFTAVSAQESFNLCGSEKGSIYSMGALYSSIWWSVRVANGSNANEVDRLFMRHLEKLTGDDDFVTVQAKILTLDQALNGGKYVAKFKAEFKRRGL